MSMVPTFNPEKLFPPTATATNPQSEPFDFIATQSYALQSYSRHPSASSPLSWIFRQSSTIPSWLSSTIPSWLSVLKLTVTSTVLIIKIRKKESSYHSMLNPFEMIVFQCTPNVHGQTIRPNVAAEFQRTLTNHHLKHVNFRLECFP